MKPICTVLLITYNHAPYVRKCIDSVLSQKTKYPFIIKIFDDASTDGSSDIIREYAKKYPKLIEAHIAEKNTGAQANIWRAYKSVDTKYCILTETDDYWCDDEKLQLQIDAMEKHPECSFCAHQMFVKSEITNDEIQSNVVLLNMPEHLLKKKIITLEDLEFVDDVGEFFPYISARMVRYSCLKIDEVKNKENILFDICHFYWLIMQGPFYYINKIMSVYVRTGKGMASRASQMQLLNLIGCRIIDFNQETNFKIAPILFRLYMCQIYGRLFLSHEKIPLFSRNINFTKSSRFKRFKYHLLYLFTFGRLRKKYKEKWKLQKAACRGVAK